jgi:hypothetical protein
VSFIRWIPTFLAFPLSGLLAMTLFGSVSNPLVALAGGLLAGAILGGAQWLALGRAVGATWLVATTLAVGVGMAVAVAVWGAPTTTVSGVLAGVTTGAILGAAQGVLLRRGVRTAAVWTAVVAVAWGLGWLVTSWVIVDIDRGHVVFGASGAIVVTLITGGALRLILGRRPRRESAPAVAQPVADESASL